MGDLAAYDYTKQFLIKEFQMPDNVIVHAIAAFTAGFVAAVLGTPADVMKTRLMNQPVGPDGRYLVVSIFLFPSFKCSWFLTKEFQILKKP